MFKKDVEKVKERLKEIEQEIKERYKLELKMKDRPRRPWVFYETFVVYNALLVLSPESLSIQFNPHHYGGVSYLPLPGDKDYRTVWRAAESLKPDFTIIKNGKTLTFWYDKTFVPQTKSTGGFKPDLVVRPGKFDFDWHGKLFKDNVLVAEYGIGKSEDKSMEEEGYEITKGLPIKWSNSEEEKYVYFKANNTFLNPPLIIECKGFGAVFGNPEEYAKYAKKVVVVTPEKIFQPKKENIHIVKVARDFENLKLRDELRPFLEQALTSE